MANMQINEIQPYEGGGLPDSSVFVTEVSSSSGWKTYSTTFGPMKEQIVEEANAHTDEAVQELTEQIQSRATNCLEYAKAISWQYKQSISSDSLPWDSRIILLSSSGGRTPANLVIDDVEIPKSMGNFTGEGSNAAWSFDVKAGSKFCNLSSYNVTSRCGYLIPYSYGYQQDSELTASVSLLSVIRGTIPAQVSELFDDIKVYGSTTKTRTKTYVSNLPAANSTTDYYYVVIQAKAKADNVQIKSYATKGYYSNGNKYITTLSGPSETLLTDIKTTYGAYKTAAAAKNILVSSGQYCYIIQSTYALSVDYQTGLTSYIPRSLAGRDGWLAVQNSDIVVW